MWCQQPPMPHRAAAPPTWPEVGGLVGLEGPATAAAAAAAPAPAAVALPVQLLKEEVAGRARNHPTQVRTRHEGNRGRGGP